MEAGFLTNAEFAEEFFRRCIEQEAITEKERIEILRQLVREKKAEPLGYEKLKNTLKNKEVWFVKKDKKS